MSATKTQAISALREAPHTTGNASATADPMALDPLSPINPPADPWLRPAR